MPVDNPVREKRERDSPLLRARREAGRVILRGYLAFAAIGLFLNGLLLGLKFMSTPDYQPTWVYLAFLLLPLIGAWLSLRWLDRSLRRAMLFFTWVGTITITLMIAYDSVLGDLDEPILTIFAYHVGVFTLGLILGFKSALRYAIVISLLLVGFGVLYGDVTGMVLPIILAFAMTLPSWLVDRLAHELQQSERKFEVIFRESLDVILVIDQETGQILRVNQAAHEILGHNPDDLVGAPFVSLFSSEEAMTHAEILESLHTHDALYRSQDFLRSDDSLCPMDLTATLVPWEDDEAILVTLRDITERRRIDEELRRHREHLEDLVQARTLELQARNEELDAFAHTVAHDIKSPLTMLVGFASLLERQSEEMPRQRLSYYGEVIAQAGRKISNIVDELLLLASVRQLEDVILEPLDMALIVAEVQGRLADMIAEYQAEIVVADSWPMARGYAPWVEEVWVNYLSNAIKYGGQPPRVELGARDASRDTLCFYISDNGPGLTPEQQSRLFTPFTRLDRLRVKGHGLGLSIVRRIVEKLGGEVGIESEIGQGTTFTFTLPRAN